MKLFVAPSLVVLIASGLLITSSGLGLHGFSRHYRQEFSLLKRHHKRAPNADYICQSAAQTFEGVTNPNCIIGASNEPSILLWGDSHASHYVPAFKVLARRYGFAFRNIQHGACPPILERPERFTFAKARPRCEISSQVVRPRLNLYDTIILSGNWEFYLRAGKGDFGKALGVTITDLRKDGRRVVVLGPISTFSGYDRYCELKALKLPFLGCSAFETAPLEAVDAVRAKIMQIAEATGAEYVDFNALLCTKDHQCSAKLDGRSLYFDRSHLSESGSLLLGKKIVQTGFENDFFQSLGDDYAPEHNSSDRN